MKKLLALGLSLAALAMTGGARPARADLRLDILRTLGVRAQEPRTLTGPNGESVTPDQQVMIFVQSRSVVHDDGKAAFDLFQMQMRARFPWRRVVEIQHEKYRDISPALDSALKPGEYMTDLYLSSTGGGFVASVSHDVDQASFYLDGEYYQHPIQALHEGDDREHPLENPRNYRYNLFRGLRGRVVAGANVMLESTGLAWKFDQVARDDAARVIRSALGMRDGSVSFVEPRFDIVGQAVLKWTEALVDFGVPAYLVSHFGGPYAQYWYGGGVLGIYFLDGWIKFAAPSKSYRYEFKDALISAEEGTIGPFARRRMLELPTSCRELLKRRQTLR